MQMFPPRSLVRARTINLADAHGSTPRVPIHDVDSGSAADDHASQDKPSEDEGCGRDRAVRAEIGRARTRENAAAGTPVEVSDPLMIEYPASRRSRARLQGSPDVEQQCVDALRLAPLLPP